LFIGTFPSASTTCLKARKDNALSGIMKIHATGTTKRASMATAEDTYTMSNIASKVSRANITSEIAEYVMSMVSSDSF